jgi:hypothetical protein
MSSNALASLDDRLKDIEQLLTAHEVLTKMQRADAAQKRGPRDLSALPEIIAALVTKPGRGRRREVEALNRASIVLLCAHLQGYVEELFGEAAEALLGSTVQDVKALVEEATSRFSNPHAYRIDRLFASIGLPRVTQGLAWQNCENETVKRKLTTYIELRNEIAHGKQITVRKAKVDGFQGFVEHFSDKLDAGVEQRIFDLVGRMPW